MSRDEHQHDTGSPYIISALAGNSVHQVRELYAKSLESDGRIALYVGKDDSPDTIVLGAVTGAELVGTVSFTADGPSGLHTDSGFADETNAVRAEGRRLFSAWRIATVERFRGTSLAMDLIRETVQRLSHASMETTLMIFPTNQVRAYQMLLGARVVAEREVVQGGRSAVAVMMRADIEILRTHRRFRDILGLGGEDKTAMWELGKSRST